MQLIRKKMKVTALSIGLTAVILLPVSLPAQNATGDGSADNPFLIGTLADWRALMISAQHWDKHFKLTNNVNLAGEKVSPIGTGYLNDDWVLVGSPFTGVFDGNHYAISNVTIDGTGHELVGLFGYIGAGGLVKNLGVENVQISGRQQVGGLCGYLAGGTISDSYVTGEVSGMSLDTGGLCGWNDGGTIQRSYAVVAVEGEEYVGGLCGYSLEGTISDSYAAGPISGGYRYIGGLVGYNWDAVISRCFAAGQVTGNSSVGGLCGYNRNLGRISDSNATGAVTGNYYVGGLVGRNFQGAVVHCYATGKLTADSDFGGLCGAALINGSYEDTGNLWDYQSAQTGPTQSAMGTGKTTAEMKMLSTFLEAGWDFGDVWAICEGANYPRLQWRILPADFVCPDGIGIQEFNVLSRCWLADVGLAGDLTEDGRVSLKDFEILSRYWLSDDCGDCGGADFNGDRAVNLTDLLTMSEQWLKVELTADLTGDGKVSLEDVAILSRYWLLNDCGDCGRADLNDDRAVNLIDLLIMSEQWLRVELPECRLVNLNGDYTVDFGDLLILVENWLLER